MECSMKMRIPFLIVAILLAPAVITPAASARDDDNGAATATPSPTGTATLAPGPTPAQGAIPGQYVVVLEEEVRDPTAVAREHARGHGAEVLHTYEHALEGYAARIPDHRLDEVVAEERVDYVERDGTMSVAAQTLPWGIDKIDADVSSTSAGDRRGTIANVSAYIIDTGIDKNHADLNVVNHVNFARGKNTDLNGHGTHIAGTVAAKDNKSGVVGVAPGARLIGVKVLDHRGRGTVSDVIEGVDWVAANADKPAIANMSLVAGASKALDAAVRESADSGIFYSVAAGNDDADARNYSPARAGAGTNNGIVTTAATTESDAELSWSNYGRSVDLWAPGKKTLSTGLGGGKATKSGTSMASAHVAGGAALYLSSHTSASPTTIESVLKRDATSTGTASEGGAAIKRLDVSGY
jgi:subtilisin family serine protease